MTEQAIRDMVSEMRQEFQKDLEFARFCRDAAPGYIAGSCLFGAVRWEMGLDSLYDKARLDLQSHGYVA